jgi:hypothetical protein
MKSMEVCVVGKRRFEAPEEGSSRENLSSLSSTNSKIEILDQNADRFLCKFLAAQ